MTTLNTPDKIEGYRMLMLLKALKLEIKGIKMFRGTTAYAAIKKQYGLRGSKQKVFDQFKELTESYTGVTTK